MLGFGDRLLSEMKKLTPRDMKIRVSHCSTHTLDAVLVYYYTKLIADICPTRPTVLHVDGVSIDTLYERLFFIYMHSGI